MMSLKEAMEYVINSHHWFSGFTSGDTSDEIQYHKAQIIRLWFEHCDCIEKDDLVFVIGMILDILAYERNPDRHDGLVALKAVLEYSTITDQKVTL